MALARTAGVTLTGIRAEMIDVQADLGAGLPGMSFTGLADASVTEARDRIRAAVVNSGVSWPDRKITVALLPADVRKVGSRFDLAIAAAILAAAGAVPVEAVADVLWAAELGLDGGLRAVHGILPAVVAARVAGLRHVVVAAANGAEAAMVPGIDVRCAHSLAEVIAALRGQTDPLPRVTAGSGPDADLDGSNAPGQRGVGDLADVRGQPEARRALEIAAAGGHHLCMVGSPGAGKTMLAERLVGILPTLDDEAALEVTAVHSVAGLLRSGTLLRRPPFQAPHHSASLPALVGGGSRYARPGAISLAHRGVLFLDEAPEFAPAVLEALRQPLESGMVVLHRSGGAVSYPARFQLVLAANPCPCAQHVECHCAPQVRRRYQRRLSGPVSDRIDINVRVGPISRAALFDTTPAENTAAVAARVATARAVAAQRWRDLGWQLNASAPGPMLRSGRWALSRQAVAAAENYVQRGALSARGFDRVLRLSWSVADLAGHTVPDAGDVAEALYFRTADRAEWAA
jgi:magnesium chelatase family protein